MFIESIELSDYRNYSHLHIDFHKGTNVLYGDNAQGKTNILEAVYVCSTTKSHRGSKDKEIIRFGADESHIKMMVRRDGIPYRIDMHLKKNKAKGVAVNGVPIKKAVNFRNRQCDLLFTGRSEHYQERTRRAETFRRPGTLPAKQAVCLQSGTV